MARCLGLAFPYNQEVPAVLRELLLDIAVTFEGSHELALPEGDAGLRNTGARTSWVAMPKATVDENDFTSALEHDIGVAGYPLDM